MKIYVLTLIMGFGLSAFGQEPKNAPALGERPAAEPCRLKLNESPIVRGLRLGMPKSEVRKNYPAMTFTSDPITSSGIADASQITNAEYQKNLERILISFRNDEIFSVIFTYDTSVRWDSDEEFARKISESLKLPRPVMRQRGVGNAYYSVNCGDFLVRTRISGDKQPILLLTRDPSEIWETSKQKKDDFKP